MEKLPRPKSSCVMLWGGEFSTPEFKLNEDLRSQSMPDMSSNSLLSFHALEDSISFSREEAVVWDACFMLVYNWMKILFPTSRMKNLLLRRFSHGPFKSKCPNAVDNESQSAFKNSSCTDLAMKGTQSPPHSFWCLFCFLWKSTMVNKLHRHGSFFRNK